MPGSDGDSPKNDAGGSALPPQVDYSVFRQWVVAELVQEVHMESGVYTITLKEGMEEEALSYIPKEETQRQVAGLADGVNLVDEDDAGSHFAGLLEQVPDSGRAHTHKHLHKVKRSGDSLPDDRPRRPVLPQPAGQLR